MTSKNELVKTDYADGKKDDGLKKTSPITIKMTAPTITITRGLLASDKNCVDVPISEVPTYLRDNFNCYERTLPTERNPSVFNRAYIDLDGCAGEMSEMEYEGLRETIKQKLLFAFPHDIAMMEANVWDTHKVEKERTRKNKLSFRINFTKKHGSKNAIKAFVADEMFPLIKEALADDIPVFLEDPLIEKYLDIDLSVYNPLGRKMRMWNSSKENEWRQNQLVGDATIEDTLITFIPADSVPLPEPEAPVETPKRTKPVSQPTLEYETNTLLNQPDPSAETAIITQLLEGLSPKRHNNYNDFIKVGFICFNEGVPLCVWEDWAKKSPKNKEGDCAKHWRGFRKGNITQATLWKWLKEDNIVRFKELCPQRNDFWSLIFNPNHAETARFFFNLKPDAYVYNEDLGWFQLLPSSVWKHYQKTPSGLMYDIWRTLKEVVKEHWDTLDPTNKADEDKIKACNKFGFNIGNKGFIDGVVSFLPSIYNDDELVKKMNESRHLFAFNDKVADLDANEVRDIRPDDWVSLTCGYDFPKRSNPAVRKELHDLLVSIWENEEMLKFVLTTIAVQLHGRKKHEKFFVWTGRGRNGKGLITEFVKKAFGDYYHTIGNANLTKRKDKPDAPQPELAMAIGKRLAMSQEPEEGDKLQIGGIKEWTGGDEISARRLFKDPIKFVPQFGLFFQCNGVPRLSTLDDATAKRIWITPFWLQFVDNPVEPHQRQINPQLKDQVAKRKDWRDEFVLWLLEIFPSIPDNIVLPDAVKNACEDYLEENDAVYGWLSAHYKTKGDTSDKNLMLGATDLRNEFLRQTNTKSEDMSASKFKTLMERNGCPQKRMSNAFSSKDWDEFADEWSTTDIRKPAGSYFLGLRPLKKDEK